MKCSECGCELRRLCSKEETIEGKRMLVYEMGCANTKCTKCGAVVSKKIKQIEEH